MALQWSIQDLNIVGPSVNPFILNSGQVIQGEFHTYTWCPPNAIIYIWCLDFVSRCDINMYPNGSLGTTHYAEVEDTLFLLMSMFTFTWKFPLVCLSVVIEPGLVL